MNIGLNLNKFKQNINSLDKLPKNLIININNGFLSTNNPMPVLVWSGNKMLIAVIDETATDDKINQYQSKILLTSTSLVIRDGINKNISLPYTNSNIKITKDTIIKIKSLLLNIIPLMIVLISFYFIILHPIFITIFLTIFLSFLSFIAMMIYKSKFKKITFQKTFQISIHAITLPIIIYAVLMSFNNMILNILSSYIFLLLSFAFILISIYDAYQ